MQTNLTLFSNESEEKKRLMINSSSFLSPITQARLHITSLQETYTLKNLLTALAQIGFASSSAAFLTLKPSSTYAENRHLDPVFFQISGFLSGFLINLYALNCLRNEIKQTNKISPTFIASFFLGILTAIPMFCIQNIEQEKQRTFEALMISILVASGSVPLQILGFLDFNLNIPRWIRQFHTEKCSFSRSTSTDFLPKSIQRNNYLARLENGFNNLVLQNNVPDDYMDYDELDLIRLIIQNSCPELTNTEPSGKLRNIMGILAGLTGVLLAECNNASSTLATYRLLSNQIPGYFAALLTSSIIFPMLILSAEFGYSTTHDLMEGAFILGSQMTPAISGRACNIKFNLPCEMQKLAGFIKFSTVLLIVSQSYAPWVQFNIDTFDQEKTNNSLIILNPLTAAGAIIFNLYVMNNISNEWLCWLFQISGNINLKKKAEFYEFGQVAINLYKKMPEELLISSLDNIVRLDADTNVTATNSFSISV